MTRTPRCRNPLLAPVAAAVFACALLLSACFAPAQPPSDPARITGSVTSVVSGDGRPASMLVESTGTPAGAISDKAQVNIPPATMFFGPDGMAATLDSIGHIAAGTHVRVWFEGAVAESYPVQGSAKAVQILGK